MTDVTRALEQLDEIHARMASSHVYRGWRSLPVALSGLAGLLAAWLQPMPTDGILAPRDWVIYWLGVALCAFVIGCAHLFWRYVREESTAEKRRTEEVLMQFLPALAMAVVISLSVVSRDAALAAWLPGIWAACFGIGIFAARPFIPAGSVIVAIYYALAAVVLLWSPSAIGPASGWLVGGVFCAGQWLAALILYWSLER